MKDKEIIDQLMHGNHLEEKELERARIIIERLKIEVKNRRQIRKYSWRIGGQEGIIYASSYGEAEAQIHLEEEEL